MIVYVCITHIASDTGVTQTSLEIILVNSLTRISYLWLSSLSYESLCIFDLHGAINVVNFWLHILYLLVS